MEGHWLRQLSRTAGLVPTHSGEAVGWILWNGGSSPSWDWMLYSALSGAAGWDAGPAQLIVWGPESGRNVHGRCWRPVSLCRQVWPWAVLSVQLPLSAGLSDGCAASHVFWESSLVGAEADGCLQHQVQLQIGFPAQAQQEQQLESH